MNPTSPITCLTSQLQWADDNFPIVCFLNSNINTALNNSVIRINGEKGFNNIIAVGSENELFPASMGNFERLKKFYNRHNSSWLFGFLSYDLKNETENLSSSNFDGIGMPLMHFFAPELVWEAPLPPIAPLPPKERSIKVRARISKKEYIEKVNEIKKHIKRGDIYELNFCQEFYAENVEINPLDVYLKLNKISPMPFSCYYKLRDKYLLCASPERFLKKKRNKIISQPIKGTIRRGINTGEDDLLIKKLFNSKKEQSENVMIVDLVRNDLSRIAKAGTVKVDELCGIYSFNQLHQMISTVSCELKGEADIIDVIKNCFPMGSMTGAPKVRAMELIEKYEITKRGLFSGAVGYFAPEGDFDFNVVIRSILYDKKNKYVSMMAGSAITAESNAEKEYEECLLKAETMIRALGEV